MFKNYFQHTSIAVKKVALALRALVATATGSAFVQGEVKLAFYVLIAGGLLDFILQLLPPSTADAQPGSNSSTPSAGPSPGAAACLVWLVALSMVYVSCTVIKPGTNTSKTDSTYTTYKQVAIDVKGATVTAGLNMDSLFHAALMAKDQRAEDSIGRLNMEVKYKTDSLTALKAGNAIPAKPVYIQLPPQKQYVTDPNTKAQLTYWIDAYGKFQITCEAKDQTITSLQAQVTKLTKQVSSTTVTVPQTPVWAKVVMWLEGVLLLICIIILFIKSII